MAHRHIILSTALLPEAQILQLEQAGIFCDQTPFIQTEASITEANRLFIDTASAQKRVVVFTSANAVTAVTAQLAGKVPDWRLFCISGATKEAAGGYFSLDRIAGSADDAQALVQKIGSLLPGAEILFFCGNRRLDTLPDQLSMKGIAVRECCVYKTIPTPVKLDKDYDALLFFSPSGVESYLSANDMAQNTVLFSIGHTTAQALKARVPNKIIISPAPGRQQLVETVLAYYKA